MTTYTFGLAGTTEKTTQCAQALLNAENFTCSWVITPSPQPIGRKKLITKNPVDNWAQEHSLPTIHVSTKIDQTIQQQLADRPKVDFLVVVDFGYIVPTWLLNLPNIAPINVHPSALPAWRGSSPAQFALLYDQGAGITIMIMNQGLDEGPILWQQTFMPQDTWTQTEYYRHSLELAAKALPEVLLALAQKKLAPIPQPTKSPTTTARQLKKADGFVSWKLIQALLNAGTLPDITDTSNLLQHAKDETNLSWQEVVTQASRAFQPWPELWTLIPTAKGTKRMKLITCQIENNRLVLEKVQIEGQQPALWNQVKNIIRENQS